VKQTALLGPLVWHIQIYLQFVYISIAYNFVMYYTAIDRLCGLVVRVLGYRSGGPGSIPGTPKNKKK
jgi:hypothetical protein